MQSKKAFLRASLGASLLTACVGASAQQQVETFESVGFAFLDNRLPSGLQFGLSGFSSWFVNSEAAVGAAEYQATSGTQLAFVDGRTAAFDLEDSEPITWTSPFVFVGAYFSGTNYVGDALNPGPVPLKVSYKLYDSNNALLAQTTLTDLPATDGALFVPSGFAGLVSSVVVYGHSGFYGMDDFTFAPPAIPEPSTYLMMLAGVGAVGAVARRRVAAPKSGAR